MFYSVTVTRPPDCRDLIRASRHLRTFLVRLGVRSDRVCVCVFSLEGRFEDEELQQILDDIQTKRSFQY